METFFLQIEHSLAKDDSQDGQKGSILVFEGVLRMTLKPRAAWSPFGP